MDFLILIIFIAPLVVFYFYNKHKADRTKKPLRPEDPLVRFRPRREDELMLGWAAGEDDATLQPVEQLKAVLQEHRGKHFYVVGGSGSGKTKFLESLIVQDIVSGHGFAVLDPHGDLTDNIMGYLFLTAESPQGNLLREKVILIDPTDKNLSVGFNPLEIIEGVPVAEQVGELVLVFKKIWEDSWGARMEDILSHSLLALAESRLTLADLHRFLTNGSFREKVLQKVNHKQCLEYFQNFNTHSERIRREWTESTLNKVHSFMLDERLAAILSAPKSTFSLRDIIDTGKILLIRLDKGHLKGGADLLGALLLAKVQMAAFSRAGTFKSERRLFYFYIDEFQNFATDNFTEILSEARKYKLAIIAAHQHLSQLPLKLRDSVLTNCGLQAFFNLSRTDAELLAKEALTSAYAQPPGWEEYIQLMQELPPRWCVVKNKTVGGAVMLRSLDMPDPHELIGAGEREFKDWVEEERIGQKYLRPRKELLEAHEKLLEELAEPEAPETFEEPAES